MDRAVDARRSSRTVWPFWRNLGFAWLSGIDELSKRFKSSLLGGLWLIVGPTLLMIVYWVVFDHLMGVNFSNPSTGVEVPFLAAFAVGFFNYMTFSELVGQSTGWFKSKRRMITETSLPLWAVFGVLVSRAFVQYACYLIITIAILVAYGLTKPEDIGFFLLAALPVFILFSGVALIFAFLGLYFADVREIVPIVLRVMLYVSSITFPLAAVPAAWQWVPMVNPLTWAVELNRDLLLWGHVNSTAYMIGLGIAAVVVWIIAVFLYVRLASSVDEVV